MQRCREPRLGRRAAGEEARRRRPACSAVRASATMPSRSLIMFEVTSCADLAPGPVEAFGLTGAKVAASATREADPGGALNSASLASGLGIFASVVNVHSPFSSACTVPISLPSAVIVTAELGSARPAKTEVPSGSIRAMSKGARRRRLRRRRQRLLHGIDVAFALLRLRPAPWPAYRPVRPVPAACRAAKLLRRRA